MRPGVALYARVSTRDKDQDPENQLRPMREYAHRMNWVIVGEFVDHAPAGDLNGRVKWRELLALASVRRFGMILCWKIDRCFRSVLHASETLDKLRHYGIGLRSYTEPFMDTSTPGGELIFTMLSAFAQFERAMLSDRVKAGMAVARHKGKRIGRPPKKGEGGKGAPAPAIRFRRRSVKWIRRRIPFR